MPQKPVPGMLRAFVVVMYWPWPVFISLFGIPPSKLNSGCQLVLDRCDNEKKDLGHFVSAHIPDFEDNYVV